ncbi:MAG: acyl carrier protein [Clostridia bacterium]|nr:acyl carrier protein [Clostridia bacterium]
MANEIFDLRVREVIANTLEIKLEEVVDTADIVDDLGADSIDVLDLIMALEEEFDISISDADVINNRIVEDIVAYIVNHK